MKDVFKKTAELIKKSDYITVFTGAGISVESGIPPFRGENGIWNKYDPSKFSIDYFYDHPKKSWELIREVFYDLYGKAKPNLAHKIIADWEKEGIIEAVVTQNIDGLHQKAGSNKVYEFHGTTSRLICLDCGKTIKLENKNLSLIDDISPRCTKCKGILKPDFIFFGEGIPEKAYNLSLKESKNADLFLVIGTTGEVMPASFIPQKASAAGAKILEINVKKSNYTKTITDFFLKGKATQIMKKLNRIL